WCRRDEGWTLVRNEIPPRPANIPVYTPSVAPSGKHSDQPVLSIQGLSKRFGSIVTSNDISMDVHDCKLHSLIGPNGAGKTTLFNILTGLIKPDTGKIIFDGQDITAMSPHQRARAGLSRSFQILSVFPNLTTFENVRVAVQGARRPWGGSWAVPWATKEENVREWSLLALAGWEVRPADSCSALFTGKKGRVTMA